MDDNVNRTKDLRKKLKEISDQCDLEQMIHERENHLHIIKQGASRARSVTVGTAFGGTTEVGMRADNATLWAILQPTEVLELIHQLAGNIGCHINIQPRKDFGSWRGWKEDGGNFLSFDPVAANLPNPMAAGRGHAPHPEIDFRANIGIDPQPIIQKPGEQNETLAITQTVNKRKSKRTTTPT